MGSPERAPSRAGESPAGESPCPPDDPTGCLRRRGKRLEDAIYDAVADQLATVGYGGLTMEGVAACAHTGKASLYRRWASKEELVVDALEHVLPDPRDLPDCGNVRDDLLQLLHRMATVVNSPWGRLIQALAVHRGPDEEVARAIKHRALEPRQQMLTDLLQRAADRGEIPSDAVVDRVADVCPAMLLQYYLTQGPPIPDGALESIVDDIAMPLLRAPAAGSSRHSAGVTPGAVPRIAGSPP